MTVFVLLSALAGLACGREEEEAHGDESRFCQLVRELDRKAEGAFMNLPPDPSPEQLAAAVAYFRSQTAAEFQELQRVAPAKVRSEVRAVAEAQQQAAAGDIGLLNRTGELSQRLTDYQRKECAHRR